MYFFLLKIQYELWGKVTSNKTGLVIPTGDGMNSIKGNEITPLHKLLARILFRNFSVLS